jgi:hypothetical protein
MGVPVLPVGSAPVHASPVEPPLAVQDVASAVDHESVVAPPAVTVAGEAANWEMTAGAAVTVSVSI